MHVGALLFSGKTGKGNSRRATNKVQQNTFACKETATHRLESRALECSHQHWMVCGTIWIFRNKEVTWASWVSVFDTEAVYAQNIFANSQEIKLITKINDFLFRALCCFRMRDIKMFCFR